jgi:hypothetical protein
MNSVKVSMMLTYGGNEKKPEIFYFLATEHE